MDPATLRAIAAELRRQNRLGTRMALSANCPPAYRAGIHERCVYRGRLADDLDRKAMLALRARARAEANDG